jgi:hypothetical protein
MKKILDTLGKQTNWIHMINGQIVFISIFIFTFRFGCGLILNEIDTN